MSALLTLASDFIERMANPAYGIRVNEDHALRFATLLNSEGFVSLLQEEAKQLHSTDSLTPHGWLWLLTWARSQGDQLNGELLLNLADTWSSVFMQASVIDAATMDIDELISQKRRRNLEFSTAPDDERRIRPIPLDDIGHPFLRSLLHHVTHVAEGDTDREEIRTQRAENTLVALLQIDREVTLKAASSLLHHDWRGQQALLEFYRMVRAGLDDETQQIWDSRLGTQFAER